MGPAQLVIRVDPLEPPSRGQLVHAHPRHDHLHVFSAVSECRLADGVLASA
jgi:hypothetical protein